MACSPHTCNSHNTGTSTCAGHRAACSTNRTISWYTSPRDITGDTITAAKVEEVRADIRAELARWNQHSSYNGTLREPSTIVPGATITNETFNNLDLMIGYMYGSYLADEVDGNIVGDDEWENLLNRYNSVRDNCICNSDCSCNSICSCYGNCGCNYSDERLKIGVQDI